MQGASKLSVACGAMAGNHFVTFVEGGIETFGHRGFEDDCFGVFAKVVGPHSARNFKFPMSDSDVDATNSALASLHLWVGGVPTDAVVLLAIVGLKPAILEIALLALAPLGVPEETPPPHSCQALAAVGKAQNSHGSWGSGQWY